MKQLHGSELDGWVMTARSIDSGAAVGSVGKWRFSWSEGRLRMHGIQGNEMLGVTSMRVTLPPPGTNAPIRIVTYGTLAPYTSRGRNCSSAEWSWELHEVSTIPEEVRFDGLIEIVD